MRSQPPHGRYVNGEWVPTFYALEDIITALWRWIRRHPRPPRDGREAPGG